MKCNKKAYCYRNKSINICLSSIKCCNYLKSLLLIIRAKKNNLLWQVPEHNYYYFYFLLIKLYSF